MWILCMLDWEGRLEVCFGQRGGTVGSDRWTQANNEIVCCDLGYTEPETGRKNATLVKLFSMEYWIVCSTCANYCS